MSDPVQEASVWKGVYERFEDIPEQEFVFNESGWVLKQQQRVLKLLSDYRSDSALPDSAVARDYPLYAMIASLLVRQKKVRVIDFGGSMGQTYVELLSKVPSALNAIEYIVVETDAVTRNIPEELSAFPNLSFVSDYKTISGQADIVHMGSALQYIDNWRALLSDLSDAFKPEIFILSDLLVGDIPSFVTAQSYYGKSIRVRFTNIGEFLEYWSSADYSLIYRSQFWPLMGDGYFPRQALPETHRIKCACHLVFVRHI